MITRFHNIKVYDPASSVYSCIDCSESSSFVAKNIYGTQAESKLNEVIAQEIDKETLPDFDFRIIPNPNKGQFVCNVAGFSDGVNMIIRNNIGAIVYQSNIPKPSFNLDFNDFRSGIYSITITNKYQYKYHFWLAS